MFLGDAPSSQNGTPQEGDDEPVLAETVAMTIDAGRMESGLETEDGSDLRVELLTVVSGHDDTAADLLAHAATMISQDPTSTRSLPRARAATRRKARPTWSSPTRAG